MTDHEYKCVYQQTQTRNMLKCYKNHIKIKHIQ